MACGMATCRRSVDVGVSSQPDAQPESSAADRAGMNRWNRFLFRFFGPPSVGRLDAPALPVDPDPRCPHCGAPESDHRSYRTAEGKTLRSCPSRQA